MKVTQLAGGIWVLFAQTAQSMRVFVNLTGRDLVLWGEQLNASRPEQFGTLVNRNVVGDVRLMSAVPMALPKELEGVEVTLIIPEAVARFTGAGQGVAIAFVRGEISDDALVVHDLVTIDFAHAEG